jgi:hypothetical protein
MSIDDHDWRRKRNRGLMLIALIVLALAGGVWLTVRLGRSLGRVGEQYKQAAEEP